MAIYALYCTQPYPVNGGTAPAGSKINRIVLDDVTGYAVADGLELRDDDAAPVWRPPAAPRRPAPVPEQVSNADARRVMLRRFVPDGRSFYSVVNGYLQSQVANTASQPDNDPNKIGALTAWTQWDMGNFFYRSDPLVASMAQVITASGGEIDLDKLFIEAAAL